MCDNVMTTAFTPVDVQRHTTAPRPTVASCMAAQICCMQPEVFVLLMTC